MAEYTSRLDAVWSRWQAPLSFSAFVSCLCITTLGVPPLLGISGERGLVVLLGALSALLLAGALLSSNKRVTSFITSKPARVLIFALLSPFWILLLVATMAPSTDVAAILQESGLGTAPGWAIVASLAAGLAMLIYRWLWGMEHGLRRPLIESLLAVLLVSVCCLAIISVLNVSVWGAALMLLVTALACLMPESRRTESARAGRRDTPVEPPRHAPTFLEGSLFIGICAVAFAFQALGSVAQTMQSHQGMSAIYLAGALVVVIFLAAQLYLARARRTITWKNGLVGCAIAMCILAAFLVGLYRDDPIVGVKTLIMLFGATCFVVGVLLFVSLYARFVGRAYLRTALYAQAAVCVSIALATFLVGSYGRRIGEPTEDAVLVLLLVVALVTAGFLLLLVSHKGLSKAILGLAANPEVAREETADPPRTSLEDRCLTLQGMYGLTAREGEVLLHAARGKTAGAIAESLYITRDTANTHVQHIYRKFGVNSRDTLIEFVDSHAEKR